MKNSYQKLISRIHVPNELNQRVQREADRTRTAARHRTLFWLKPAVCFACVFVLLIGGGIFEPRNASHGSTESPIDLPLGGLVMTACAADLPQGNQNGGLGIAAQGDGKGGCLFQIKGSGIKTITLTIDKGSLFHEGSTEEVTKIEERYDANTTYGIRLFGESATLSITANGEQTQDYLLTQEKLRLSQSEDGKTTLVPLLDGDPAQNQSGIYAVRSDRSRRFVWPVENANTIDLSMPYGAMQNKKFHCGIDIPAAIETPVFAAADGEVTESGHDPEMGIYVVLDHGNGLVTRYHHCKEIIAEEGAKVKAGDTIAFVGKSGMATGAFLHFEVRQDGTAQDPIPYFDAKIRSQLKMA